ncbi:MAG: DNA helicase RecQ [Bacteroides sp.]|nr:DNA helicase RecQ [Ruminococcus flavefaciens]MCM1555129.1 DNA helicase RecQ [Bacteroides sp.]
MEYDSEFLRQELLRVFGFSRFKGNQEAVIRNVLSGKDTFVIMPTGGGKSLCYQLPALILPGTAIIVSPLIALMKNQVDAVRNFGSTSEIAHYLNSSLTKAEMKQVKEDLTAGKTKLLYVAPETLTKEENVEFFKTLNISLYAIDEAHCISEWGHDFRPEYRRLRPIIDQIGQQVPVMALTATATPKVQKDIQKNLGMTDASVFISSFNRQNLYYEVRPKTKNVDRDIVKFIRDNSGKSGIIYCLARKKVEEFAEVLCANGIRALPYHAGLDSATRTTNQDKFLMEEVDVIVATIAFGMGIDKPDVRFVIHYDMPKSLEGYYQETGRAGRDGGEGKCIAFYCEEDIIKLEKFLKDKSVSEQEVARQLMAETISYAETSMCRRKNLLHYFGEKYEEENCHNCDNCLYPKEKEDATENARFVVQLIFDVKQQFKTDYIVALCMGKMSPSIKNYKHNLLPQFGKGKDRDERYWKAVIRQCIIEDLLSKDIEDYGVIKVTPKGEAFVKEPYPVQVIRDHTYNPEDEEYMAGGNSSVEAVDKTLYLMLKDLLKDIAHKENLPPYVIFQDISIKDMTVQYPITMEDMTRITGVGVDKAKRHGQPFLDLIKRYVEDNEIERPQDFVIKSVVNKSGLKVYIIQSIDRKVPLDVIAQAKSLTMDELLTEIERIVDSGTRLNLDYYIEEAVDSDHQEDIYDYFSEAEDGSVQEALDELGDDEYTETEIRLVRLQFLCNEGN